MCDMTMCDMTHTHHMTCTCDMNHTCDMKICDITRIYVYIYIHIYIYVYIYTYGMTTYDMG